jgi:thioredoxin 1
MVAPVVEELAGKYQTELTVAKLDVDVNGETAMRYQVQAIPTLILFKGGEPVERIVGFRNKGKLVDDLKEHLAFLS